MNFSSMNDREIWKQLRKNIPAKNPLLATKLDNVLNPFVFLWIRRNRVGTRWGLIARLLEALIRFFAKPFYSSLITSFVISVIALQTVFLFTGSRWLFLLVAGVIAVVLLPRAPVAYCNAVFMLRWRIFEGDGLFIKRRCVAADDLPAELRPAYTVAKSRLKHASIQEQYVILDRILFPGSCVLRHCVLSIDGLRRGYPVLAKYTLVRQEEINEEEDFEYPQDDE